ncbi:MAG: hypothetical protein ACD_7C00278G0001 [uncultured bacterium]|nr:MAG: hypothetical protein ACD_7C00278G0001 [uncultured bacterium]
MTEIADIKSLRRADDENGVSVIVDESEKVVVPLAVTTLDSTGNNLLDWS